VGDVLIWIEGTTLGHAMRESGPWIYAIVNLTHILGVATFFGSAVVLDLRLLGLWRRVPIAPLASATVPVAVVGFAIAATSGSALIATKATAYLHNPFLYIKFPAIALGLVNVLVLSLSPAWKAHGSRELSRGERRQLAMMGGISLACWLTAVSAGRLIGYW
jgi:hypothetical protein